MAMKVKHFKIEGAGSMWKLSLKVPDNKMFADIMQLVAHYKSLGSFSGISLSQPAPNPNMRAAAPAPAPAAAGGGGAVLGCGRQIMRSRIVLLFLHACF
jgi:hypothetical protein